MKKIVILALVCGSFMFSGCAVFTPHETGIITGHAIYLGYDKISRNKSEEFKQKVEKLWKLVDSIQTIDDFDKVFDEIKIQIDDIIDDKELGDKEKKWAKAISKSLIDSMDKITKKKISKNADAQEFLIAVREGIREML